MTLHDDAREVLSGWEPRDDAAYDAQHRLRDDYLAFLGAHDDAMWRRCEPGHLTASALVLSSDRAEVLLTLHPKFGRWLQMGGHCEPADATLREAAAREALEESGIAGLSLSASPVRLDRHRVRCHGVPWLDSDEPVPFGTPGSCWHLDCQYVAVAPAGAEHVRSEESLDLAWWPVGSLPDGCDGSVRRLVATALTL